MTAIGELLRALLEAGSWTAVHKPNIIYVADESQFKSGDYTNSSKLFVVAPIPPWGSKEDEYPDHRHKVIYTVHWFLERDDSDDDKLSTQITDMYSILQAAACTGYDDNYMDGHEEIITRNVGGVRKVMAQGDIKVEDWIA